MEMVQKWGWILVQANMPSFLTLNCDRTALDLVAEVYKCQTRPLGYKTVVLPDCLPPQHNALC